MNVQPKEIKANCCSEGRDSISQGSLGHWWLSTQDYYTHVEIRFCPHCGWDLSIPLPADPPTLADLIKQLCTGPKIRICFDVDGVLCDDRDPNIPYVGRVPYPDASPLLTALKDYGHTVVIQTARYMKQCNGDQLMAIGSGTRELRYWLNQHNIPYHEMYMGKASADIYVDDRGCRVQSNHGLKDFALLAKMMSQR